MATPSTPTQQRIVVPPKRLNTEFPLIDSDPHFKRVIGYARTRDYAEGAAMAAFGPGLLLTLEKFAPSYVGKGGFPPLLRLAVGLGLGAGFFHVYQSSSLRFYGWTENKREQEMDMREMVAKVKKGERLYGESTMTPYMQGMAARNSRYTGLWLHVLPWFNLVNHDQHGVDTAKYYQQAERELEAERMEKS